MKAKKVLFDTFILRPPLQMSTRSCSTIIKKLNLVLSARDNLIKISRCVTLKKQKFPGESYKKEKGNYGHFILSKIIKPFHENGHSELFFFSRDFYPIVRVRQNILQQNNSLHLFIPTSKVKDSMKHGRKGIRMSLI